MIVPPDITAELLTMVDPEKPVAMPKLVFSSWVPEGSRCFVNGIEQAVKGKADGDGATMPLRLPRQDHMPSGQRPSSAGHGCKVHGL